MLKITEHPTNPMYTSKGGTTMFRYLVEGTKAELADYKAAKGEFHRIDEETKKPLFFTSRYAGKSAELRRTEKDEKIDFVVNDNETRKFASLVAQYGIDVAKVQWAQMNAKPVVIKPEGEEQQ